MLMRQCQLNQTHFNNNNYYDIDFLASQ